MIAYTEGLKKKCADPDLNVVLYTNRAAAQYYLGNLFHCWVLSKELTYDKAIMMASGEFESVREKGYLSQIPPALYSNAVVANLSDLEDHRLETAV